MKPYSVSLRRCTAVGLRVGMPARENASGHRRTDRCVVAGAVAAIIHAAFLWPSLFSEEAENGTAENGAAATPIRLIIGKNAATERRTEQFWP